MPNFQPTADLLIALKLVSTIRVINTTTMPYEFYPIRGIHDGLDLGAQVPIRREFKEWSESQDPKDRTQVVLFILSLKRFQAIVPESRDSYFQIAGIHGMPYTSWDEPSVTTKEAHVKGYCVHANNLFPPWHRPYMLLYEQRIYEIMVHEVIPEQPQHRQSEFFDAARTWRLPFWDWAKNPKMPYLLCCPEVNIRLGDSQMTIDNPLYKFKIPTDKNMGAYGVGTLKFPDGDEFIEYGECYATSRCPTAVERDPKSKAWKEGVVHEDTANTFMTEHSAVNGFDYGTAAELVYRLLTYPMDYSHFATLARDADMTSASITKVTNDINLEFIHNNIHYWVGGDGGHMSQIPVATFDPVFWLHHCNIDRLFAIWQTLNPDQWFVADNQKPFDQKVIGMGDVVTSKTPLRPFHKDVEGSVWMPDDTRDWFKLGYTYPELRPWLGGADYKAKLFADINETYGISRREALQMAASEKELPKGVEIKDRGSVELNDYAVSIRYSKFAFDGHPFNLEVYLRPEGKTEKTYHIDEFVTNVYNFSQPDEYEGKEICTNCRERKADDVQVTAYVPLTSYLIKMIQQQQLSDLNKVTVEKFLSGLYYRLTMAGKPISEDRWGPKLKLQVAVSQTKMKYSENPEDKSEFTEPEVIPSLGTGAKTIPSTPGVVLNDIPVYKITALREIVSAGGSIVIKSPYINLDIPKRERTTGVALLYLDSQSTADAHDVENYDVLLSVLILSKRRVLQCSSKPAGHGYGRLTELEPRPWFEKENPQLRIDVKADSFNIFVDGREIKSLDRAIKGKSVTHIRYWTMPGTPEPVLARSLTVTTYKQTGLIS
ncbi:tyrosinase [Biscogniauxia marginata]|nr:tyrosinase [Biscogniauxia marginata]